MTPRTVQAEGTTREIVIERDFSRYPGGRFRDDGQHSGEEFRDDILVPALNAASSENGRLIVDLDGAAGYSASFLEEAFGGLVRERGYSQSMLQRHLIIRAGPLFDSYRILALRYIADARPKTAVDQR